MSGADLARISELASRASLDVSPRGVTPRLDGDLQTLLDDLDDADVDALAAHLDGAEGPVVAMVWGGALARIGSPAAAARLDAYAAHLTHADPWPDAFPGRREVLQYLGRSNG